MPFDANIISIQKEIYETDGANRKCKGDFLGLKHTLKDNELQSMLVRAFAFELPISSVATQKNRF